MSKQSVIMVSVQLICIAILVITGPVIPSNAILILIELAGVLIAGWAIAQIGFRNLRIQPDVAEHAKLVNSGPYRWIRHPMYTGGTLLAMSWVANEFSILRLIVTMILIADFVFKLRYEEKLLMAKFPDYRKYMKGTKRLIPFIY